MKTKLSNIVEPTIDARADWLARVSEAAHAPLIGLSAVAMTDVTPIGQFPLPDFWRQLAIDRSALASWSAPQAPAASPMQSEPATARLIVQSSREMSGKPVRLALALQGQSEGAVVTITGLVPGMELSNGDPIGAAAWRLTATDLDDIWIGPPDGFVGSIDLVAELRLPEDEVVDRQTVRLEWLPSVSPAFAQWQRDREDIMPQQRKSASPSFAPSMPTRRSFTGNHLGRIGSRSV